MQEPEFIDWEDYLRINLYLSSTDLLVAGATDKETNAPQTGSNTTQGTAQATQGTTQATQETAQAFKNTTQDRGKESNLTKVDIAILRISAEHPKFTQRDR